MKPGPRDGDQTEVEHPGLRVLHGEQPGIMIITISIQNYSTAHRIDPTPTPSQLVLKLRSTIDGSLLCRSRRGPARSSIDRLAYTTRPRSRVELKLRRRVVVFFFFFFALSSCFATAQAKELKSEHGTVIRSLPALSGMAKQRGCQQTARLSTNSTHKAACPASFNRHGTVRQG